MTKAVFYHAGCPVCVTAEQTVLALIDRTRYDVEIVHLGEQTDRVAEAQAAGVKSVPALMVQDNVLHLNFGASVADLIN